MATSVQSKGKDVQTRGQHPSRSPELQAAEQCGAPLVFNPVRGASVHGLVPTCYHYVCHISNSDPAEQANAGLGRILSERLE